MIIFCNFIKIFCKIEVLLLQNTFEIKIIYNEGIKNKRY